MHNLRPALLILAALALLSACTPQGEDPLIANTRTPSEAPTETPAPPTAIPPSPTLTTQLISQDNVRELSAALSFDSQGEALRSLAFSPDSTTLASSGGNTQDFNIRLWDVGSGQLLRTLHGHTGIVWNVAFSHDGAMLASASSDGTVKVWDWKNGTLIHSLDFPNEMVSVGFSPDSQTLAAGGVEKWPDAAIWTYAVGDWQPVLEYAEFWNIPDLAYTPDGQILVGGGTSRNVRVWRTSDGEELSILYHAGQVTSMDMSPDGSLLATGLCSVSTKDLECIEGAVWFWDVERWAWIRRRSPFTTRVTSVAFSPDGSLVFAGSEDGTLRALSGSRADRFRTLRTFTVPGGRGLLAISPDGRLLATLGENGAIRIWKVSLVE